MSPKRIKLWYENLPGLDKKGKPTILPKPFIDVVINYKHGQMLPTKALVDSGSDTNLFPGVFCRSLGISIKKGIKIPILGIGKRDPITAYRHFGIKMYLEGYSSESSHPPIPIFDFSYPSFKLIISVHRNP